MIAEGAGYCCSSACDGTIGVGDSAAASHSRASSTCHMSLLSSHLGQAGVDVLVDL
jgi:hypothetical protein